MDKPTYASSDPLDFSEPWKLSDVVLVVEEQKFYVHRSILGLWSPVFERMFTGKTDDKIPLPGKKASEIKELLQIMYPSLEEKVVTKGNCYFLLDLAREYQITAITQKCEDFLVSAVKTRNENDVLAVLIVGQEYELKTLIKTCVYEARRLSLKELKEHSKCGDIERDNYQQITEEIIARLEEHCKVVKANCLQKLLDSSRCLYLHGKIKGGAISWYKLNYKSTSSQYLNAIKADDSDHKCSSSSSICPSLSEVGKHLTELKSTLETLP
ncbi:kelch-like protein 12 [Oculina patagonica]